MLRIIIVKTVFIRVPAHFEKGHPFSKWAGTLMIDVEVGKV